MSESSAEYILFIDEAGDDGLKRVRPIDVDGGTEWLCLSGFLIRAKYENDLSNWLEKIRVDINSTQSSNLHFRKLSPKKKLRTAKLLAEKPCRAFVVASNKKNMRGYRNKRAESASGELQNHFFYNWCVRLLLERVTDFCLDHSMKEYGEPRVLKIFFSKRGGHRYGQTKAYLEKLKAQARAGTTLKDLAQIKPEVLRYAEIDDLPAYMHPGLQFADILASAFYQAIDILDVKMDLKPAKILRPIIAKKGISRRNFGVVLQPTPPEKAKLLPQQQEIFEFYGYRFDQTL